MTTRNVYQTNVKEQNNKKKATKTVERRQTP
jgi:hypothetical protein